MRRGRHFGITGTALVALLTVPIAGRAQEQTRDTPKPHKHYTLVDLGTLGGPTSSFEGGAVALNNGGAGTGVADTSLIDPILGITVFHAFRWRDDTLTDLGALPGGALSIGQAINQRGAVAGFSANGLIDPVFGLEFVATTWDPNGQITDLGTLGGEFSITNAISDPGLVVGAATNTIPDPDGLGLAVIGLPAPTQWHAAVWQNGAIRDLGTLGEGTISFAPYVNNRGQVAGFSTTDTILTVHGVPTLHPFFWEANRGLVDVGTLGGVYSLANGLNSRGQVVGFSTIAGDETNHAFLWDQGVMQDLGTLGGTQSAATAINDKSEIVGEAYPVAETFTRSSGSAV